MKTTATALLVTAFAAIIFFSCKHEIPKAPGPDPGTDEVCFENDVLPIFQSSCAKSGCHDAGTRADDYQLDSYANIVAKGIKPGNAADSKIYEVLNKSGDDRMPQPPNAPLTTEQKELIAKWINEGAKNTTACAPDCDSSDFTYSGGVKPILQNHCTGCHGGDGSSGGYITLDNYEGVKSMADFGNLFGSITHTGTYQPMPQGGNKLSDCKIAIIRKWIGAGAPNN